MVISVISPCSLFCGLNLNLTPLFHALNPKFPAFCMVKSPRFLCVCWSTMAISTDHRRHARSGKNWIWTTAWGDMSRGTQLFPFALLLEEILLGKNRNCWNVAYGCRLFFHIAKCEFVVFNIMLQCQNHQTLSF